jgi:hypothetical protein
MSRYDLNDRQSHRESPVPCRIKKPERNALSGGITNLNFKVEADGKAYVIRLAGANTELLGIKRDVEHVANKVAGELGIAPEVMYFIEPEGYIVTSFINGRHIPAKK